MATTAEVKSAESCDPRHLSQPELQPENIALEVKNVTVTYRSYKERPATIKESFIRFLKTGQLRHYSTFNALENISFQVPRGQVFGIIGSNGAGKSTLLRTLSGTLPPSSGRITVNGKVDSLIQLGAGFDSDLNAVENIYLSSSLHERKRKDVAKRIPQILEFAELTEFAQTPVRYYSSGMYARLGFATAIDREPDILLVDEVLAVGDERFQKKCKKVFRSYLDEKKTIVMVSHSMGTLENMASQICLLSRGQVMFIGDPKEAVRRYRDESYRIALDGNRLDGGGNN